MSDKDKKRLRGIAVHRSLLIGTTSTPLSHVELLTSPPDHTHKWTVAVRSASSNPLPSLNSLSDHLPINHDDLQIDSDGNLILDTTISAGGNSSTSTASANTSAGAANPGMGSRGISTRGRDLEDDYHKMVGGKDDISHYIKRVQFKLHETYPSPTRNLDRPPFQVTETGWGEFEIQIKIFFVSEANEKPLTTFHHLKLHPWQPVLGSLLAFPRPDPKIQGVALGEKGGTGEKEGGGGGGNGGGGEKERGGDENGELRDEVITDGNQISGENRQENGNRDKNVIGDSEGKNGEDMDLDGVSNSTSTLNPILSSTSNQPSNSDLHCTSQPHHNQDPSTQNPTSDPPTGNSGSELSSISGAGGGGGPSSSQSQSGGGVGTGNNLKLPIPPVVHSWQYEEIVFPEPTEAFFDILNSNVPTQLPETSAQAFSDPNSYLQFTKLRDHLLSKQYLSTNPILPTPEESTTQPNANTNMARSTRTAQSQAEVQAEIQAKRLISPPHPIHSPTGYLAEAISCEEIENEGDRLEKARIESVKMLESGRERLIGMERRLRELRIRSLGLMKGK